jgi:hypothetical protein
MMMKLVPIIGDLNFLLTLKNKRMYELSKQIIILLLILIASFVLGFVPQWSGTRISVNEQTILTVVLFMAFLLVDVLLIVSHRLNELIRQHDLWTLREDGDVELSNIRSSFYRIVNNSYGKRDLFVTHFLKEFRNLSHLIRDVTDRQELRVAADHFLSVDNVLDAFLGDEERVWRYTWPLNPGEKLFGELPWKRYFEVTANMLKKGEIKSIRAMLIVDNISFIQSPRIEVLLDFFKTNDNMDCRIIETRNYQKVCEDNRVPAYFKDFGIYGSRLLFRTEQYESETEEIIGTFSKDIKLIQNYVNLFDAMWSSVSVSTKNPSTVTSIVSLEKLFETDELGEI